MSRLVRGRNSLVGNALRVLPLCQTETRAIEVSDLLINRPVYYPSGVFGNRIHQTNKMVDPFVPSVSRVDPPIPIRSHSHSELVRADCHVNRNLARQDRHDPLDTPND